MPDEGAKDVAISNQWPPTHIIFSLFSLHTGRLTLQDQADGDFGRFSLWQLDVDSLNSRLFREVSKKKNSQQRNLMILKRGFGRRFSHQGVSF